MKQQPLSSGSTIFYEAKSGLRQNEKNVIKEIKPVDLDANDYIIREIRLGKEPLSLKCKLDKGITRTNVLYALLTNLNEKRERQREYSLKPLAITIQNEEEDPHTVLLKAASYPEMETFLKHLVAQQYISKTTSTSALFLIQNNPQTNSSSTNFTENSSISF